MIREELTFTNRLRKCLACGGIPDLIIETREDEWQDGLSFGTTQVPCFNIKCRNQKCDRKASRRGFESLLDAVWEWNSLNFTNEAF